MAELLEGNLGQRFSLNYLCEETLLRDSKRMRQRLAVLYEKMLPQKQHGTDHSVNLGKILEGELGIDVVSSGNLRQYVVWKSFLLNADQRDVLDSITLVASYIGRAFTTREMAAFLSESKRILEEEQVGFLLDDKGGIHPRVDLEFERSRRTLIRGLEGDQFNAARGHIDAVEHAILATPIDGRQAIRSVFDLAENIILQCFKKETNLNTRLIDNQLKPQIQSLLNSSDGEKSTAGKQIEGFKIWVNSAHYYRHEDGKHELIQPSEEMTIHMVSVGFSYVRWLVVLLFA